MSCTKLDCSRAGWVSIVLVEDGVEAFSSINGIQQIRFERGNIRSTFGDVLATLRREYSSDRNGDRHRRTPLD